jgi:hypothetical protein
MTASLCKAFAKSGLILIDVLKPGARREKGDFSHGKVIITFLIAISSILYAIRLTNSANPVIIVLSAPQQGGKANEEEP